MRNPVRRHNSASTTAFARTRSSLRPSGISCETWLEENFSAKRRKEFRRLKARLAETGELAFESLEPGEPVAPWVDAFIALERAGWKGRRGTAIGCDEALAAMLHKGLGRLAAHGDLGFWKLSLDKRPVAMLFAAMAGERAWLLKIAHDEALARFSPGALIILEATRELMAAGRFSLIDSCATPGHPLIEHLWRERIAIADIMIAAPGTPHWLFALLVAWDHLEHVQVWHVFIYVTVSGVAHAILQPVRSALVANTVPKEDLGNAYALQAMGVTSSRFVLPAVGGVLISQFGFTVNFFMESAMYIVLALLVIPMRTPYREQAGRGHHGSTFADLKEGVRYVWKDKPIMQLLVLSFIPNFFVQPSLHLLPVFAGAVLHRGPEIYGTLLSMNGLAGFSATLVVASFGFLLNKGLTSLLVLMVSSVGVILLGLSQWLPLTVLAVCIMGFGQTVFRVSNNTMIQTLSPDALRGRIQSIYHLDHGLTPLAGFIIGVLADQFTPRWAVTGVGLASLVLSVYFLTNFRRIRQLA